MINGVYVPSTYEINKKIIQALGSAVFNSNYRFEIGVESMKIVDKGFKAIVTKELEYGKDDKFVVCNAFGKEFIIKVDEMPTVGSEVSVDFNLDNVRIFENRFDIRLF